MSWGPGRGRLCLPEGKHQLSSSHSLHQAWERCSILNRAAAQGLPEFQTPVSRALCSLRVRGMQRDRGSTSPLTSSSWSLVRCAQLRAHGACFPLPHLTCKVAKVKRKLKVGLKMRGAVLDNGDT